MKRFFLFLIVILSMFMAVTFAWGQDWQESSNVKALFDETKVEGTFVLFDVSADTLIGYDRSRAETRFIPASTFKIPNSLIGLSQKAVKNVDEILPYGGKPQPVKSWEKDMSLRDAIKISNITIYQELARRIGIKKMRSGIIKMHYGNGEIGEVVDTFWLKGPLKISAVEQARFLARLALGKLPFSSSVQAEVRDIVKMDQGSDWTLFAKTGTAATNSPELGWWVGWVEKSGRIYAFALNIDMKNSEDYGKRVELGKACLKALGIL